MRAIRVSAAVVTSPAPPASVVFPGKEQRTRTGPRRVSCHQFGVPASSFGVPGCSSARTDPIVVPEIRYPAPGHGTDPFASPSPGTSERRSSDIPPTTAPSTPRACIRARSRCESVTCHSW